MFILSFKRFFNALLILSLVSTGLFLAASEWLLRTQVGREDIFNANLGIFHAARDSKVRNGAFGDSAIARGFLPPSFDFINLGVGGESHFRSAIKLRAFFASRPAGKVLLVASPHSLFINDPTDFGDFYQNVFSSGKRPVFRILELRNRFFIFRFWRKFLASAEFEARSTVGPFGGLREKTAAMEVAYSRQIRLKREKDAVALMQNYDRKTKYWDHVRDIYREMVVFLKSQNADICLVGFPYSASFTRAAAANEFITNQIPEFWRDFSRNNDVKYINLFGFFDSDEPFLDETHVNKVGASIITDEILRSCFGDS